MKRSKVKLIDFSTLLPIILIVAFTPPGIETHETNRLITAPRINVWSVIAIHEGNATLLDNCTKKIKEVAADQLSLGE